MKKIRKKIRNLMCSKLGWHKAGAISFNPGDPMLFQGYSECVHCGFSGMIDSQGNLF